MKKLIVYKSLFGSTKQYAEWLKEDIKADIGKFNIDKNKLRDYDLIIVMSGTYMGMIPFNRFLKKRWSILKDKNVVVINIGMAPQDDTWSIKSYNHVPEEIKKKIKYFKIFGKMGKDESKFKKENLEHIIKFIQQQK